MKPFRANDNCTGGIYMRVDTLHILREDFLDQHERVAELTGFCIDATEYIPRGYTSWVPNQYLYRN